MNFSTTTYFSPLHPQKVDKGIQVDPPAEAGSQTTPEPPDNIEVLPYIDVKGHHLLDGATLQCTSTDGHHCTGCIEFNKCRATTTVTPVYATTTSGRTYAIATSSGTLTHAAPQGTAHYCDVHGTIQTYREASPGPNDYSYVDNNGVAVTVTPVVTNTHQHVVATHPGSQQTVHIVQPSQVVQQHQLQTVVAQPPPPPPPPHPQAVAMTQAVIHHAVSPSEPSVSPKTKKALRNMRPYVCETCEKTFYKEEHLVQHRRVHSGERPFKCNLCDKTFRQSGALHNHKQIHVGSKNFHCDICNKSFAHARNLKCHVRTHTGERPYQCDQCSKCFTQAQHLAQHKKLHAGQMHSCEECGQSFTHPSNLERHNCGECGKPTPTRTVVATAAGGAQPITNVTYQRVQVVDPNNPNAEPTSIVVATTPASSGEDSEDRKYFTTQGDELVDRKYFTTGPDGEVVEETELVQVQVDRKFYGCDMCDKTFQHQVHLDQHRKVHEGHIYACNTCGKGFTQPRNLHRHQMIHTGERPFSCTTCGKAFNQSTHLTKHMKLHGMELPYTCRRCGERFRYKSERERHKKAYHAPTSPLGGGEDGDDGVDLVPGELPGDGEVVEGVHLSMHHHHHGHVVMEEDEDGQVTVAVEALHHHPDLDDEDPDSQGVGAEEETTGTTTVYTTETGELIDMRDVDVEGATVEVTTGEEDSVGDGSVGGGGTGSEEDSLTFHHSRIITGHTYLQS